MNAALQLKDGLLYCQVSVSFQGQRLSLNAVIVDTGSERTLFAIDRLSQIGVTPELNDPLHRIRGVGGDEYVFLKTIDRIQIGTFVSESCEIEVGKMDYGFELDGIIGLDLLLEIGAVIDLVRMEMYAGNR
ncbi:MAG: retropepsin-like aspartic protease [Chloroflexota bacterium]|nr:retropepsin-like aspartic protease [Chloroflexota bacterium]